MILDTRLKKLISYALDRTIKCRISLSTKSGKVLSIMRLNYIKISFIRFIITDINFRINILTHLLFDSLPSHYTFQRRTGCLLHKGILLWPKLKINCQNKFVHEDEYQNVLYTKVNFVHYNNTKLNTKINTFNL